MRLTCKVKFDWNSMSHWSGDKESLAQPILTQYWTYIIKLCSSAHPKLVKKYVSTHRISRLNAQVPALYLAWLLSSWPITHRIPIKLHLTGKSRLIFKLLIVDFTIINCRIQILRGFTINNRKVSPFTINNSNVCILQLLNPEIKKHTL